VYFGPEPAIPVPSSYIQRDIKLYAQDLAKRAWESLPGLQVSKRHLRENTNSPRDFIQLDRRSIRQVTTAITGHGNINMHLHKMGLTDSPLCPKCEMEEETMGHHIEKCPAYALARLANFYKPFLQGPSEWGTEKHEKLAKFLSETGRLSLFNPNIGGAG